MVKYSRMEENKRVYEEQYDTDEYEALTCECHHLARAKELNGSRRKPFFCIYCKSVYKDKNKLNLHRLEGCFAVTNDGRKTVLKIYPMFGKGQRGEIEDILIKHGLMSPRKKPSRAKRKKDMKEATMEESGASLEAEITTVVQITAEEELTSLRPQKLKVRGAPLSSSASFHEAKTTTNNQHFSLKTNSAIMQPSSYGHHHVVMDNPNNIRDNPTVVVGRREMQVQMQLTREQVEAQAWEVVKACEVSMILPEAFNNVAPPEVVPCPGLWHLMQFQLLPSDFPDVRGDAFLHAFFEFVDKGLIDPGLRSSYGTWYMERETDADEEERDAVKLTMSRFKLVQGRPDLLARHKEKTAVQAFLHYQRECAQYKARKEAAEKELQIRREKYVKEKLEAFDASVQAHKEFTVWPWSPLQHILKSDAMRGVPPGPWSHSEAEYSKIAHAVLINRSLAVRDPPRCPLIVRLFKIVYLYCFEKNSTLSDPATGLLRETMLGYSTSESAAPVLRISAQSVLNEGCFMFANLPPYSEAHAEVFQDINWLLYGSAAEREAIVQKVQGYLQIVRQRAIGDMAQLHPREFRVLWCGGDDSQVTDALNKFMLCLKSREDLDMGWVPFPQGHPDCDSVAVMLAREAVVKAIHKLHDQRLLSDKARLLAASSHLPSHNVNANEKFQALVETCVVQNSETGKISTDSANGSSRKDLQEDESRLDRHSSYSTTSGSVETQQDSRSSQEAGKNTAIDVERPHHQFDEPVRKPFSSSPDLNLNLVDSNETYNPTSICDSPLTNHMAGLQVVIPAVVPPKTVSVMGVEVQTFSDTSIRPPFPLHFSLPSSTVLQRPSSCDPLRPSLRISGADSSVSDPQAMVGEYSRRNPPLFPSQSSFSTTTSATTHMDSMMDSSTTPSLTNCVHSEKEK